MTRTRRKVPIRWDIYLSGPISSYGDADDNLSTFVQAARKLRDHGYRVFCPPEGEPPDWTWEEYMRADIQMLMHCRALVLLPRWHRSKGARLERSIASRVGLSVYSWTDFAVLAGLDD